MKNFFVLFMCVFCLNLNAADFSPTRYPDVAECVHHKTIDGTEYHIAEYQGNKSVITFKDSNGMWKQFIECNGQITGESAIYGLKGNMIAFYYFGKDNTKMQILSSEKNQVIIFY